MTFRLIEQLRRHHCFERKLEKERKKELGLREIGEKEKREDMKGGGAGKQRMMEGGREEKA